MSEIWPEPTGFDIDDETLGIGAPAIRRAQIRHERVVIGDREYEVPVLARDVLYWTPRQRVGLLRPSPLWDLVKQCAGRRMRVCSPDGWDVMLRESTDPEHVWDAIFAYGATYDNAVMVVVDEGVDLIEALPVWDVWDTSFDLQGWTDTLDWSLERYNTWQDRMAEIRLAHKIAWERVWEAQG